MNWKRVCRGGILAAAVIWSVEMGRLVFLNVVRAGLAHSNWWNLRQIALAFIPNSVILGCSVSLLYVLVRPRLGPGPKTAVIIGTLLWVLQDLYFFNPAYLISARHSLRSALCLAIFTWIKFVVAACLAGWQYHEIPSFLYKDNSSTMA